MAMTADGKKRCAQCTLVAFDVFPKMLQDLLSNTNIPPSVLHEMISNYKFFRKQLRRDEETACKSLLTDDFRKLDVILIYKIFRAFHLIKAPTRDWGPCPLQNDTEIGDDVERIKRTRNHLFHKIDANVSEQAYTEFFENILAVSKRIDKYLKKTETSSYEKLIQDYKSYSLDSNMEEKLLRDREREGCFELIAKCILESQGREIHIMARKTLVEDLNRCASTEGDSVSPIKIYIDGIDNIEDFIQLLNSLKNKITTEFIEFIRAEKGCIILFAEVKNKAIYDTKLFVNEVTCLLRTVFSMCKFACKADQIVYAVITSAEEECIRDDVVESEEEGQIFYGNDDSIVLHVDIKNTAFAFSEKVGTVFTDFFENVVKNGNGQHLFGQKNVHAVLARDVKDEKKDFGTEVAMIQAIDKDDHEGKHNVRMTRQIDPLVIPETHIQHQKRREEENRKRLEAENQKRRLEEENRIRLEEDNRRRLEEENQRRRLEEENRRRLEEENQRRRLEEENRRRLEEENRRRLEEENRRRLEEENQRRQDEERKKQEEKDRRLKKEKDLNEEVQFWKTVRNETLPNLERLRQELEIANEKIRKARSARNATVAATLVGGALFSIFTGGASMAAALGAVAVTGAAGITLLIETYVEKDVLSRTQEGINKDKEATLRLITRVRAYRGTESIPFAETLFTVRLESIDDLARDPLQTFISSLFDVQSNSLRKAIDRIIEFRRQLEKELQEVERVQRLHRFQ